MAYVLYCLDKPGAAQVRLDNRTAHLDYAKGWGEAVYLGGPLLTESDADGSQPMMVGSLIVLNVETRDEVDRFVAGDPYGQAGLFESVTVHPFKIALEGR